MARLVAGFWVGWMLLAGGTWAQEDLQDSLSVDRAMSDSLRLDSLTVNTTILEWEELWAEWCATTHCVSSDTSLWNVSDAGTTRIGDNLDSATVATGLAAMNVLSELDLRWNPCGAPSHCDVWTAENASPGHHVGPIGHVLSFVRGGVVSRGPAP